MMPITDISYYYTASLVGKDGKMNYVLKELNYFELLQLPRDFNADEFKSHIRKLFIAFHPDHNPDDTELRAEVFKKISPAWNILKDSAQREAYVRSLEEPSSGFHFVPFTPPSAEESEKMYREYMAAFTELNEHDDFDVIYRQLYFHNRSSFITLQQIQEQRRLFMLLNNKVSTGNDAYRLVLLQRLNDSDYGHPSGKLLQIATNTGHLQAMRMRIGYVLLGSYAFRKEQIAWALDCIKYLEEVPIPALRGVVAEKQAVSTDFNVQTSTSGRPRPSSESLILADLVAGLRRVRERVELPAVIPVKGSEDYNHLIERLDATLDKPSDNEIINLPVPYPVEQLALRYESGFPSQVVVHHDVDAMHSSPVVVTEPEIVPRPERRDVILASTIQQASVPAVNLAVEPEGIIFFWLNEDPSLREIKKGLQAYLNKVQTTYKLKFDHGFRFFSASQAENRQANYLLAQNLLEKLNAGTAIEEVFSSKKTIKEQRLALMNGKKFRDHGINSKDLNEVISTAINSIKAAKKNAGAVEVPAGMASIL